MPELSPAELRILAIIMRRRARRLQVTQRQIADELGGGTVHGRLLRLRAAGLVSWEKGKKGTIIATCAFIPAEQLK